MKPHPRRSATIASAGGGGFLATQPCHAVAGISDRSPQSLATNARVCGLTCKQWKPTRSYVPATHERDGMAPRSRSCATSLIVTQQNIFLKLAILLPHSREHGFSSSTKEVYSTQQMSGSKDSEDAEEVHTTRFNSGLDKNTALPIKETLGTAVSDSSCTKTLTGKHWLHAFIET